MRLPGAPSRRVSSSHSFGNACLKRTSGSSTPTSTPDRQNWTSVSSMPPFGPAGAAISTKTTRFNRRQLELGERVLADVPHVWGSCWGFQVIVTVCGGKVAPARTPEIGIATGITARTVDYAQAIYRGKPPTFDAPAHHFDEIAQLPREFDVIAENAITLQAVVSKDRRVFCTQYHPELPYDYIGKLLMHWAPNYTSMFTEEAFQSLLAGLKKKEKEEKTLRKIEFRNWLEFVGKGR